MDIEKIFAGFFSGTYTQSDARRRLNILDIAFEKLNYGSGENNSLIDIIRTLNATEEDHFFLINFLSQSKELEDKENQKKFLIGLKEEILRRPVLTLTLPFEPTREQIASYGKWVRENVHEKALLTIVFSVHVIGGCSIIWQGKEATYDLEYLLKAKRNEILAVVDMYAEKVKHERVI